MKIWKRIGFLFLILSLISCVESSPSNDEVIEDGSQVKDDTGKSGGADLIEGSSVMSSSFYSAQAVISPVVNTSTSARFTATHQISVIR